MVDIPFCYLAGQYFAPRIFLDLGLLKLISSVFVTYDAILNENTEATQTKNSLFIN